MTIDEFIKMYENATNRHDLVGTLALIDEAAIYLFSDESVHIGKNAIEKVLKRNFDLIEGERYSLANLTWLARTDELAVCVYDYSWSGKIAGEPASGSGRGTSVIKRSGSGWKVIHEHLSRGRFVI